MGHFFDDFKRLLTTTSPHKNIKFYAAASELIVMKFISALTLPIQPHDIEEHLDPIIDLVKKIAYGSDVHVTIKMVDVLFDQSILSTEPSFHYTGALVCKYLSKQLRSTNFGELFLKRCQEEYLKREEHIRDSDGRSKLCGYTKFIGELFLNLELEYPNGTLEKISSLRSVLRKLLLTLLTYPTDVTIETVSHVLKLTGAEIEDSDNLHIPDEDSYDAVYLLLDQIEHMEDTDALNEESKLLIKSVLTLKENNWGRTALSRELSTQSSVSSSGDPLNEETSNVNG